MMPSNPLAATFGDPDSDDDDSAGATPFLLSSDDLLMAQSGLVLNRTPYEQLVGRDSPLPLATKKKTSSKTRLHSSPRSKTPGSPTNSSLSPSVFLPTSPSPDESEAAIAVALEEKRAQQARDAVSARDTAPALPPSPRPIMPPFVLNVEDEARAATLVSGEAPSTEPEVTRDPSPPSSTPPPLPVGPVVVADAVERVVLERGSQMLKPKAEMYGIMVPSRPDLPPPPLPPAEEQDEPAEDVERAGDVTPSRSDSGSVATISEQEAHALAVAKSALLPQPAAPTQQEKKKWRHSWRKGDDIKRFSTDASAAARERNNN